MSTGFEAMKVGWIAYVLPFVIASDAIGRTGGVVTKGRFG